MEEVSDFNEEDLAFLRESRKKERNNRHNKKRPNENANSRGIWDPSVGIGAKLFTKRNRLESCLPAVFVCVICAEFQVVTKSVMGSYWWKGPRSPAVNSAFCSSIVFSSESEVRASAAC